MLARNIRSFIKHSPLLFSAFIFLYVSTAVSLFYASFSSGMLAVEYKFNSGATMYSVCFLNGARVRDISGGLDKICGRYAGGIHNAILSFDEEGTLRAHVAGERFTTNYGTYPQRNGEIVMSMKKEQESVLRVGQSVTVDGRQYTVVGLKDPPSTGDYNDIYYDAQSDLPVYSAAFQMKQTLSENANRAFVSFVEESFGGSVKILEPDRERESLVVTDSVRSGFIMILCLAMFSAVNVVFLLKYMMSETR